MSRIVVVAPHPDDETLGCGGTLLRHKAEGDEIHWLIMTMITEASGFSKERVEARQKEISNVVNAYEFSSVYQARFIAKELDLVPKKDLIDEVSSAFNKIKPDTIYLPYRGDIHSDHKAVHDAVTASVKPFRYPFIRRVLAYETLSETEFGVRAEISGFKPNLWINITDQIDKKIKIMKMYEGEMGEHPFPRSERSIRALAIVRGARCGQQSAEAFMILQEVNE